MRRTHLIGALVGVLALVLAAVAAASPQFRQTAELKYSTGKAQRPAGVSAELHATDPGAQPPGAQPAVRTLRITLVGARANARVGSLCRLARDQAESCPARTRVGTGEATANLVGTDTATGQPKVVQGLPQTVVAFQTTGGFYFVVKGVTLPTTAILKARLSRFGVLSLNVERDLPTIPGGNKIVLTDFQVKIDRVTRGRGRGARRRALITTPRCGNSRRFRIVSAFTYTDGTSKKITSRQRCRR